MNTQKPSPIFHDHSGLVELHSIFPTIQGEGIYAGHPATFVRLAGCNLRCPACDTEYTDGAIKVRPKYIIDRVSEVSAPNKLVVITGGEPLRQDISALLSSLIAEGYTVQIETNGTLAPSRNTKHVLEQFRTHIKVVCSPKGRVHAELLNFIDAYKYVLSADHISVSDGLPTRVLDLKVKPDRPHPDFKGTVYVQPMDSKSAAANYRHQSAAIRMAMTFGYVFCLQVHKIINVE